jgi:phosphatidylglycerol:prolipoprotein diacylglycerol transferase
MLAYYLHKLIPFIWEIRPGFGLRWYGFAYVLAFIIGYWLYRWLAERGLSELQPEKVGDFITWGAVFGVLIGGRLGQIIFYDWDEMRHDPLMIVRVWNGGMSSHGGIMGLFFFGLYYSRRHKLSWAGLGDNLCVVAPIGLFFGRIANFINGELYGRISNVSWAVQFPKELYDVPELAEKARTQLGDALPIGEMISLARTDTATQQVLQSILSPRHPSQIYEAFLEGVVLFCVLWFLRIRTRQPRGVLTGLFFVLYALLRIVGEVFREPEVANTGPFTRGQFLSLFLIAIGIAFVVWGKMRGENERAQQKNT